MKFLLLFEEYINSKFLKKADKSIKLLYNSEKPDLKNLIKSKFEHLKLLSRPDLDLLYLFQKRMHQCKTLKSLNIWLDQVIYEPYYNLKSESFILESENYYIYKFDDTQYKQYLKVSKGAIWCTHNINKFKYYSNEFKNFYIIINNNLLDYRNNFYKIAIAIDEDGFELFDMYDNKNDYYTFLKTLPDNIKNVFNKINYN